MKLPHESRPWNPIIANVFYRAGIIERWGSGTLNVVDWCIENGNPAPEWQELAGSVFVTFRPAMPLTEIRKTGEVRSVPGTKLGLSRDQVVVLRQVTVLSGVAELLASSGRTNRTKFRDQVLRPLLEAGLVEMTIPDKPRSSRQQYRLTEAGKKYLDNLDDD